MDLQASEDSGNIKTYDSELVASRVATELILEVRYMLRSLGVAFDGPALMLGYNIKYHLLIHSPWYVTVNDMVRSFDLENSYEILGEYGDSPFNYFLQASVWIPYNQKPLSYENTGNTMSTCV
jgi:hypothetical protein